MTATKLVAGAAALALLVACQARFGKDESETAVAAKGDEGSFSIDLPGFAINLDMPERWAEQARINSDSKISRRAPSSGASASRPAAKARRTASSFASPPPTPRLRSRNGIATAPPGTS